MPLGFWPSPAPGDPNGDRASDSKTSKEPTAPSQPPPEVAAQPAVLPASQTPKRTSIFWWRDKDRKPISWNDSLNAHNWEQHKEPRTWIPSALVVTFAFGFWAFYRSYLRRIPASGHVAPGLFRRRSLLGKVTSVGDGDGLHLFHTPGGRLAGWGWLRSVPTGRKELKGRTISIRIAGVDAPEGAHFGRPAQPYAAEALEFLKSYVLGRRVRTYLYKRDQYERIVATVFVRKPPFFLRRDVGLELLKRGLATVYEGKTGAEFGGEKMEQKYKAVEALARKKRRGMWSAERAGFFGLGKKQPLESPKAYKDRIRQLEKQEV